MTIESPYLTGYFPLWGAIFDSESIGIIGQSAGMGIAAYIPDPNEWLMIQKTDVWINRFGSGPSGMEGPHPPLCIIVMTSLHAEDYPSELERVSPQMMDFGRDAMLALRLFKPGWFLDPHMAEMIFRYEDFNTRLPGPYRQIFMAGVPEESPTGYDLHLSELGQKKDQQTPITRLANLIMDYSSGKRNTSVEVAIENFNRSYGFQLKGTQRVAFLFTSLDAMFGGMSAKKIGKVKLRTKFVQRVDAALRLVESSDDMVEEVKWLDDGNAGGRALRNATAHGRPALVESEAQQNYTRLQAIIRLLLRQYLGFIVKWREKSQEISTRFNLPQHCSATQAYNLILRAHALQSMDATDVLKTEFFASTGLNES